MSDDTVRMRLRRQGLETHVKMKNLILTKKHKARRYSWANKCMHATWLDLSYVIYSDESKFILFGSYGRQYCWNASLRQTCATYSQFILFYFCGGGEYYGLGMHESRGSGQPSPCRGKDG